METIRLDDINILDIGNSIQVAGVVWTGLGLSFITLVPGKKEDFSNLKLMQLSLEDWQTLNRQSDLQEVEMLRNDVNGLAKIIVRKTQRQLDAYLQWACFKRDNYHCRYCGRDGIPLTVDHCDLWEEGGAPILENFITACRKCNKDRGNTHYEDWIVSQDYLQKSKHLSAEVKQANLDVLKILPDIRSKRVNHIRSR